MTQYVCNPKNRTGDPSQPKDVQEDRKDALLETKIVKFAQKFFEEKIKTLVQKTVPEKKTETVPEKKTETVPEKKTENV